LKYSRDAERQADLLGTQILYDSRYDPRSMVQFFEKLQAQSRGNAAEFFSSHPNPENRIHGVQTEIEKLGGLPNVRTDSSSFQEIKRLIAKSPSRATARDSRRSSVSKPANPSGRFVNFNGNEFRLRYPDNWNAYGEGSAVTFAPSGGIVSDALAWGMIVSSFEPDTDRDGRIRLESATDQLLNELRRTNPGMRIAQSQEQTRAAGHRALSAELTNDSPVGGKETDWIVTLLAPDGLLYYFVGVSPQRDFTTYAPAFETLIESFRLR
jgi:predicted Zn-dependent protease